MKWPQPHFPLPHEAEVVGKISLPSAGRYAYFALTGFSELQEEMTIGFNTDEDDRIFAVIRPVEPVPTPEALSRSISTRFVAGRMAAHCPYLRHELEVDRNYFEGNDLTTASWVFAIWNIISLRAIAALHIPAVSEQSWSKLSAISDNSCEVVMLDDRRTHIVMGPGYLSKKDVDWIGASIEPFSKLTGDKSFQKAVRSISSIQYLDDPRQAVALVWSALEALFQIDHELRFRFAITVASLLRPPGPARGDLFKELQELYDLRSRVVHGTRLGTSKLDHIYVSSIGLLAEVLSKIIELGKVPNEADFLQYLLE